MNIRVDAAKVAQAQIQLGDLTINVEAKNILCGTDTLHLTPKEYDLLEYFFLCHGEGRLVTKVNLYQYLYNNENQLTSVELRRLDVFIAKVRKKLRDAKSNCSIATCGHKGFRLSVLTQNAPV